MTEPYDPTPEEAAEWFANSRAHYVDRFNGSETPTGYDLDAARQFDANAKVLLGYPSIEELLARMNDSTDDYANHEMLAQLAKRRGITWDEDDFRWKTREGA